VSGQVLHQPVAENRHRVVIKTGHMAAVVHSAFNNHPKFEIYSLEVSVSGGKMVCFPAGGNSNRIWKLSKLLICIIMMVNEKSMKIFSVCQMHKRNNFI
jgi:hypothetical protein